MGSRQVPGGAVAVVCSMLVASSLFLTFRCLAVNGDGAYFLLRIADTGSVTGFPSRVLANAARQSLAITAVNLGVTDLHVLAVLLGIGQLMLPTAFLVAAVVLARRRLSAFAIVSITAGVVTGATAMFSIGENVVSVALAVFVATMLWLPRPWRRVDAAAALVAAIVLTRSHETVILTAPLLAVWSAWRARLATTVLERWACAFVGSALLLAAVLAARVLVAEPENPRARDVSDAVLRAIPLELYTAVIGGAGLVLLLFAPLGRRVRLLVLSVTILASAGAAVGFFGTQGDAYRARGGATIAALLAGSSLMLLWHLERRGGPGPRPRGTGAAWVAVAFACLPLVALFPRAERWATSLEVFRHAVVANRGVLMATDVLPRDRRHVLFDWTASSLSVVVRPRMGTAVLVDAHPSYVPFPPAAAHREVPARFRWKDW